MNLYDYQKSQLGDFGRPINHYMLKAYDETDESIITTFGNQVAFRHYPDDSVTLYTPVDMVCALWTRHIGQHFSIRETRRTRTVTSGVTIDFSVDDGAPQSIPTGNGNFEYYQPTKTIRCTQPEIMCTPVAGSSKYNPRWELSPPVTGPIRTTDRKKVMALRKRIRDQWAIHKASQRLLGDKTVISRWANLPEIQALSHSRKERAVALYTGLTYDQYRALNCWSKSPDAAMEWCLIELYGLAGCYL